jgi:hypothetical protein
LNFFLEICWFGSFFSRESFSLFKIIFLI